eukprot:Rhum_TRINITY_DN13438_c0_g1::Rhum_TRINITY_DN13438_c0_g1_i1::g.60179::m.60179
MCVCGARGNASRPEQKCSRKPHSLETLHLLLRVLLALHKGVVDVRGGHLAGNLAEEVDKLLLVQLTGAVCVEVLEQRVELGGRVVQRQRHLAQTVHFADARLERADQLPHLVDRDAAAAVHVKQVEQLPQAVHPEVRRHLRHRQRRLPRLHRPFEHQQQLQELVLLHRVAPVLVRLLEHALHRGAAGRVGKRLREAEHLVDGEAAVVVHVDELEHLVHDLHQLRRRRHRLVDRLRRRQLVLRSLLRRRRRRCLGRHGWRWLRRTPCRWRRLRWRRRRLRRCVRRRTLRRVLRGRCGGERRRRRRAAGDRGGGGRGGGRGRGRGGRRKLACGRRQHRWRAERLCAAGGGGGGAAGGAGQRRGGRRSGAAAVPRRRRRRGLRRVAREGGGHEAVRLEVSDVVPGALHDAGVARGQLVRGLEQVGDEHLSPQLLPLKHGLRVDLRRRLCDRVRLLRGHAPALRTHAQHQRRRPQLPERRALAALALLQLVLHILQPLPRPLHVAPQRRVLCGVRVVGGAGGGGGGVCASARFGHLLLLQQLEGRDGLPHPRRVVKRAVAGVREQPGGAAVHVAERTAAASVLHRSAGVVDAASAVVAVACRRALRRQGVYHDARRDAPSRPEQLHRVCDRALGRGA